MKTNIEKLTLKTNIKKLTLKKMTLTTNIKN